MKRRFYPIMQPRTSAGSRDSRCWLPDPCGCSESDHRGCTGTGTGTQFPVAELQRFIS
jgi:hypothetical protein